MSRSVFEASTADDWSLLRIGVVIIMAAGLFVSGLAIVMFLFLTMAEHPREGWFAALLIGLATAPLLPLANISKPYPPGHALHRCLHFTLVVLVSVVLVLVVGHGGGRIVPPGHDVWGYLHPNANIDGEPISPKHWLWWSAWLEVEWGWLRYVVAFLPVSWCVVRVVAGSRKTGARFYRRAVHGMFIAAVVIAFSNREGARSSWYWYPEDFILWGFRFYLLWWVTALALVLYMRSPLAESRYHRWGCLRCRYDLRGSVTAGRLACPECGHVVGREQAAWIEARDRETHRDEPRHDETRRAEEALEGAAADELVSL